MTNVYYQEASAAIVVFDLTNSNSLDMVKEWKKDIDMKVFTDKGEPIPCLLIGTHVDLCPDGKFPRMDSMDQYIRDYGFIRFFCVSSQEDTNIKESMDFLVDYIMKNKIQPRGIKKDLSVDIESNSSTRKKCYVL